MLMKDPKKNLATLISLRTTSGDLPEKEESGEGSGEYGMAADEILQAIERKDSKALAEALKSFYEMCSMSED